MLVFCVELWATYRSNEIPSSTIEGKAEFTVVIDGERTYGQRIRVSLKATGPLGIKPKIACDEGIHSVPQGYSRNSATNKKTALAGG